MGGYRDYIGVMYKDNGKESGNYYIVYLPQAEIVYGKDASEYNGPVSVKHMECFTHCRGEHSCL